MASQQTRLPLAAVGNPCRSENEDCDPGDSVPATAAAVILSREDVCAECAKHLTEASAIPSSRDVLTTEGSYKCFLHTLDSLGRWPQPARSFCSTQAATLLEFHVPLMNCFVRRWFCVVHGPKPPLHRHN